jgi:putative hemolysin
MRGGKQQQGRRPHPNPVGVCPCFELPDGSRCGQWEGNVSLCVCADLGLSAEDQPAPS